MRYELIIERRQPPCGGKQPRLFDFSTVETDDPVAYVAEREKDVEFEVERRADGTVIVSFTSGIQQVRYEFTED